MPRNSSLYPEIQTMTATIDLGSRRELFTDSLLIDRLKRASPHLHDPQPQEIVLRHDRPWEGPFSLYHTIVRDGSRYLMYYRGWQVPGDPAVYCLAVSDDGIHFARPRIDTHAWHGSMENNIILAEEPFTHTMAPFIDTRPGVPEGQRFKALSRHLSEPDSEGRRSATLHGFVSADGVNWDLLEGGPLITDGLFDSQNVGFWSEVENQYVAYYRTFSSMEGMQEDHKGPTTTAKSLRRIKQAVSPDFIHWEPGVVMDYRQHGRRAPAEEFYINQTRPYFRAPHIYVSLPARFMDQRPAVTPAEAEKIGVHETQLTACSDACFMTTRPGDTWYERTFMEAFIKPRIGPSHWSARCNYPVDGVVQTGREEMSLYMCEHYAQAANQVRRYSLRLDGFISIRASHSGGELLTKPVTFSGAQLELNYATSAAGSLRVEIRDGEGKPIPGYTLRESVDIFGNRITGRAAWKHGTDVSPLSGRPVRLRFVMGDADLYSLRFTDAAG